MGATPGAVCDLQWVVNQEMLPEPQALRKASLTKSLSVSGCVNSELRHPTLIAPFHFPRLQRTQEKILGRSSPRPASTQLLRFGNLAGRAPQPNRPLRVVGEHPPDRRQLAHAHRRLLERGHRFALTEVEDTQGVIGRLTTVGRRRGGAPPLALSPAGMNAAVGMGPTRG